LPILESPILSSYIGPVERGGVSMASTGEGAAGIIRRNSIQ
jgi:hypothetical protein